MKIYKKVLFVILVCLFSLCFTTKTNAALQADGNENLSTKNLADWITSIRDMEGPGGTLGLQEIKDETTLLPTGESNNLDIHMEKNSEYGAMAILSASSYGKSDKINDGETTTGNKSGIYINLNNELVSAGTVGGCKQYVNANGRYTDIYKANIQSQKNGDALIETKEWHGATGNSWIGDDNTYSFVRARKGYGSLFNYFGYWDYGLVAYHYYNYYTRAVISCGHGL